jgi:hypothetical protein
VARSAAQACPKKNDQEAHNLLQRPVDL